MRLCRFLLLIAVVIAIPCIILLLNFTAPNPTGRRYSSQMPLTTDQASNRDIGRDAERILAIDLNLPRNEASDEIQCLCGERQSIPGRCTACLVNAPISATHRIPDFVSSKFMIEAKNEEGLLYADRDFPQIGDYIVAAHQMKLPVWVFTRVNTRVKPEYIQLVESTSGGIVQYFTVPGYIDPIDQVASLGLAAAMPVIVFTIGIEIGLRHLRRLKWTRPPTPPKKPSGDKGEDAAEFARRAKATAQKKIDTEDSR